MNELDLSKMSGEEIAAWYYKFGAELHKRMGGYTPTVVEPKAEVVAVEEAVDKPQMSKCLICGKEFKARRHFNGTGWKMYCNRKCQDVASHRKQKIKQYDAMSDAEKLELIALKKQRDKQKQQGLFA